MARFLYLKRFYKISDNPEYVTRSRSCFKFLKMTALMLHEQVSESYLLVEDATLFLRTCSNAKFSIKYTIFHWFLCLRNQRSLIGGAPDEWTLPCTVPRDFSNFQQPSSRLSSMSAIGNQATWPLLSSDRYSTDLVLLLLLVFVVVL